MLEADTLGGHVRQTEPHPILTDVCGWSGWIKTHSLITTKLKGADRSNLPAYFLALHASTESLFRQILLVGLRLNSVTYKEAQDWLHWHDITPDTDKYPSRFDHLYSIKQVQWGTLVSQHQKLERVLDLWHEFSKVIRNHLAHGVRSYSDEWLQCAIQIDQHLLIELDIAMTLVVGGSTANSLSKLVPRLPIGKNGQDIAKLTGVKLKKPRPRVSLLAAQNELEGLTRAPLGNGMSR